MPKVFDLEFLPFKLVNIMFLKKVEILGFKSFANKTTLEFLPAQKFSESTEGTPGITAIVGPNGSGKSNVADAIKWAMGEQSMKTLRGKKSEDIIFAGSGKKSRLSSAYVTLYFDNSDKRIPLEYAEVIITRKIFRSGETEYLINGNKVRLLDITELLAKAGVGKESYCVINQGMSDAVLNATPIERRMVLEDAAGVKQYQIKKERSLKKLDSTKENMERTGSLIKEIEPHLKMLKRQAEKAQQGKEVAANLKERQIKLFSYLWDSFQREKQQFSQEKDNLGVRMMNMQREVDKMNDEISKESVTIEDTKPQELLEKKRGELRLQLNEIERELIITEGRVVVEREKLANQKVIEIIPVDLRYVQDKLQKIRNDQEQLIKKVEQAESLEDLQDIKEFARAIQQELFDLHSQAGKGEVEIKKDNSKEVQEIEDRIKQLEVKKEQTKQNEKVLRAGIDKVDAEILAEVQKGRQMREKFFQLERSQRQRQEELGKLKDYFNDAKVKLARIEVREEDLSGEIKETLKCEASELKYDGEEINREKIETEISRLKLQMEQIGGIDPMIVDEYNETNIRFEFLTKELEDLSSAIVSLSQVVKEMDQKISQEFEKAFEQINNEFTKYFRIIFGGGNAYLAKTKIKGRKIKDGENETDQEAEESETQESEKKEEVGVEIFACPPGKKIANLSMLSGGERSLTSLALLFAIISHNPPPFAILDEVEAALDEANSRRFSKILQELSATTQFIAITHNRETMRQAALLYGVTMGDEGVSKLLSVRLDQIGQNGKISDKS
jgi:chromosome segregation protein